MHIFCCKEYIYGAEIASIIMIEQLLCCWNAAVPTPLRGYGRTVKRMCCYENSRLSLSFYSCAHPNGSPRRGRL